jgi:LysR family transcriptional regulator, hypochlorite-specific transcription factor HypT
METKWLEDFLSLVETKSFSRSANLRHVSQPAFSRRIKALEAWLGADLIDRTVYPTRLTQAGESFHGEAIKLLSQANAARARLRGETPLGAQTIAFAVPHTLALAFFPRWMAGIEAQFGPLSTRLVACNVHDAVMMFVEGGSDLLLCYHHMRHPVQLDPGQYDMLKLGHETMRAYCATDKWGAPLYALPGKAGAPLPYLAYAPNAYMARMADVILDEAPKRTYLNKTYETDMSEGLKAMAIEGHGIAFLPESAVAREVRSGALALAGGVPAGAANPTDKNWSVTMEIRLYRNQESPKPLVNRLWKHVVNTLS